MGRLISIMDLRELLDQEKPLLIVDIREADEFNEFHIEGSINIPKPTFNDNIHLIPRDKPVYIICKYGQKSEAINSMLRSEHHYKNIFSVLGGMYDWAREYEPGVEIW